MSSSLPTGPDLTQRPPRSPRARLGGYVMLPRILDKERAALAGKLGDFRNGTKGMNRHFFAFTGLDDTTFAAEIASGKGDGEMLNWVLENSKPSRSPWEIKAWSEWMDSRTPDGDVETLQFFAEAVGKFSAVREDVRSWFDLLELDDHCTYGGKA